MDRDYFRPGFHPAFLTFTAWDVTGCCAPARRERSRSVALQSCAAVNVSTAQLWRATLQTRLGFGARAVDEDGNPCVRRDNVWDARRTGKWHGL